MWKTRPAIMMGKEPAKTPTAKMNWPTRMQPQKTMFISRADILSTKKPPRNGSTVFGME